MSDTDLFAKNFVGLLRMIIDHSKIGNEALGSRSLQDREDLVSMNLDSHLINEVLNSPEGRTMVSNLDINIAEKHRLGSVLDTAHVGEVNVLQFMTGLLRLRGGNPDMVRSKYVAQQIFENTELILHHVEHGQSQPSRFVRAISPDRMRSLQHEDL